MTEFAAALGYVQTQRLEEIVGWKRDYAERRLDPRFSKRVRFPDGMKSGYYKYVVFEPVEKCSSRVYGEPCHRLMKRHCHLPNTDWVAANHWCVPLHYKGAD
jgi:dTDP-4-amino-4,6-dideoxygalactose transaminase